MVGSETPLRHVIGCNCVEASNRVIYVHVQLVGNAATGIQGKHMMSPQGRNCGLIEWVETSSSQGCWVSPTASSQLCQSEGHCCAAMQHEREMHAAVVRLTDTTSAAEALTHEPGGTYTLIQGATVHT